MGSSREGASRARKFVGIAATLVGMAVGCSNSETRHDAASFSMALTGTEGVCAECELELTVRAASDDRIRRVREKVRPENPRETIHVSVPAGTYTLEAVLYDVASEEASEVGRSTPATLALRADERPAIVLYLAPTCPNRDQDSYCDALDICPDASNHEDNDSNGRPDCVQSCFPDPDGDGSCAPVDPVCNPACANGGTCRLSSTTGLPECEPCLNVDDDQYCDLAGDPHPNCDDTSGDTDSDGVPNACDVCSNPIAFGKTPCQHGGVCIDVAGSTGMRCECPPNTDGTRCQYCARHMTGAACDQCEPGYTGAGCTSCAPGYVPSFEGTSLFRCDLCEATDTHPNCGCSGHFTGATCQECPLHFDPASGCQDWFCLPGWSGQNCDVCDPHHTGPECSECVDHWEQNVDGRCNVCPAQFESATCASCAAHVINLDGGTCNACAPGIDPSSWPRCNVCSNGGTPANGCSDCTDTDHDQLCDLVPGEDPHPNCNDLGPNQDADSFPDACDECPTDPANLCLGRVTLRPANDIECPDAPVGTVFVDHVNGRNATPIPAEGAVLVDGRGQDIAIACWQDCHARFPSWAWNTTCASNYFEENVGIGPQINGTVGTIDSEGCRVIELTRGFDDATGNLHMDWKTQMRFCGRPADGQVPVLPRFDINTFADGATGRRYGGAPVLTLESSVGRDRIVLAAPSERPAANRWTTIVATLDYRPQHPTFTAQVADGMNRERVRTRFPSSGAETRVCGDAFVPTDPQHPTLLSSTLTGPTMLDEGARETEFRVPPLQQLGTIADVSYGVSHYAPYNEAQYRFNNAIADGSIPIGGVAMSNPRLNLANARCIHELILGESAPIHAPLLSEVNQLTVVGNRVLDGFIRDGNGALISLEYDRVSSIQGSDAISQEPQFFHVAPGEALPRFAIHETLRIASLDARLPSTTPTSPSSAVYNITDLSYFSSPLKALELVRLRAETNLAGLSGRQVRQRLLVEDGFLTSMDGLTIAPDIDSITIEGNQALADYSAIENIRTPETLTIQDNGGASSSAATLQFAALTEATSFRVANNANITRLHAPLIRQIGLWTVASNPRLASGHFPALRSADGAWTSNVLYPACLIDKINEQLETGELDNSGNGAASLVECTCADVDDDWLCDTTNDNCVDQDQDLVCSAGVPAIPTTQIDSCPTDPAKTQPLVCGCHNSETDSDVDGIPNCMDLCPNAVDIDRDRDGICDTNDSCLDEDDDQYGTGSQCLGPDACPYTSSQHVTSPGCTCGTPVEYCQSSPSSLCGSAQAYPLMHPDMGNLLVGQFCQPPDRAPQQDESVSGRATGQASVTVTATSAAQACDVGCHEHRVEYRFHTEYYRVSPNLLPGYPNGVLGNVHTEVRTVILNVCGLLDDPLQTRLVATLRPLGNDHVDFVIDAIDGTAITQTVVSNAQQSTNDVTNLGEPAAGWGFRYHFVKTYEPIMVRVDYERTSLGTSRPSSWGVYTAAGDSEHDGCWSFDEGLTGVVTDQTMTLDACGSAIVSDPRPAFVGDFYHRFLTPARTTAPIPVTPATATPALRGYRLVMGDAELDASYVRLGDGVIFPESFIEYDVNAPELEYVCGNLIIRGARNAYLRRLRVTDELSLMNTRMTGDGLWTAMLDVRNLERINVALRARDNGLLQYLRNGDHMIHDGVDGTGAVLDFVNNPRLPSTQIDRLLELGFSH